MKSKVMNISDALDLIKDGDTLAITSAGMIGYPEYLVRNLEQRYLERHSPSGLTLFSGCGHGSPIDQTVGDNHFAHRGFLKRTVCTHPDVVPRLRKMIEKNELEAYVFPQGVLNQLYRCSAAKQPGLLTKIGIRTYIDPRQDGGKINSITKEDLVSLLEVDGEEYLFFRSSPINVALIRGTTADENGNLTIEREALKLEILEVALAAKASNGKVIVQVEQVAAAGSLKAKDVVIPGELVDAVVVAEDREETHRQTAGTVYSPYLSGEQKCPKSVAAQPKAVLEAKDIICRRAVYELFPGAVVNVGVGIGSGVGEAAAVEGMDDKVTFTLELGAFGGTPQSRADFGTTMNPVAFVSHPTMFDFYHGGGLDITFLGAAEVDAAGNVNVSRFAGRAAGQGGFIDISQTAKKVVFCTYFRAKGFEAKVADGKLLIEKEGQIPKFVDKVDQITFNGTLARETGKEVYYITERAVFKLVKEGVMLTEVATGVQLKKDILQQMGFQPLISKNLKVMDGRIFQPGRMGCFDHVG
ncbi:MAG: acyl CoA:acetate/3-ketoacid CoA transferase [Tepidanaerobacteraceae bacterium]|jgi:propionate CoA-transferase